MMPKQQENIFCGINSHHCKDIYCRGCKNYNQIHCCVGILSITVHCSTQLQQLNIHSGSMMKRRMKRSVLTFQGTLHHNLNPKPKRIEFIVIYPLHFSMTPFRCKEPQKCIKLPRSRIILHGILSLSKMFW